MLIRLCRALAAGVVLAGLVSACTISSEEKLVSDAEAAAPLPASFLLYSYDEDEDTAGLYTLDDDKPEPMTREGSDYVNADGDTRVSFVALPSGKYLATFDADGAYVYGVAGYDAGVLSIHLLIANDEEIPAIMEAARADRATSAAMDAMTYGDDGIVVTSRAALDVAIGWIESGKLDTPPLVTFAAQEGTEAPKTIVDDNGRWRIEAK